MHLRSTRLTLGLAAAGLALAACGESSPTTTGSEASGDASDRGSGGGGFPVTLEHAHGTTEIPSEPKRVVTVGWGDKDFACDLGVVPVGVPETSWGGNENKSTDEFDACVEENGASAPEQYSDADGVPLDEIAAMEPDLILATNSGLTKEEYSKLSRMAPTVAYPDQAWGTSWQDSLEMVGKALGRPEEAAALRKETEQSIEKAVARYPELEGTTAAWAHIDPSDLSKLSLYTPLDNRARMLEELGMSTPPVVEENADGKSFFVELSSERAKEVDADVLVTYTDSPDQVKTLAKDPNLSQLPALEKDAVVTVDNADPGGGAAMSTPTTLSIPGALEDLLPQLAEAAKKAGAGR